MTIESNKPILDHEGETHSVTETSIASNVTPIEPKENSIMNTEHAIVMTREKENITQNQTVTKRQQNNPFEVNKKVRAFLDLGNGKSANHFSQSTRVFRKRVSPLLSPYALSAKVDHQPHSGRQPREPADCTVIDVNTEAMHTPGRSQSDLLATSSFLSRLTAVTADDPHELERGRDRVMLMPPPMTRSKTFTGPINVGNSSSSSQSFLGLRSPFLTLDSNSRSTIKSTSPKPPHSVQKRLGRSQSHLKQTVFATPFLVKPRSLSFHPRGTSTVSSAESTASRIGQDMKETGTTDVTESLSDHEELEPSNGSTLASCTVAMSCLSPPSAKTSSPLSAIIARQRRPSLTGATSSLSCPTLDTASLSSSDSEDDQVSQLKVTNSCASMSPKFDSSTSTNTSPTPTLKRPTTFRRHQTMISSRSEFMRTLEPSNRGRTSSMLSALTKKSIVFAPDNYVPDPSREDCQILPCAKFMSKPDDTTKRITPQTVVDVLDGKYKDKYDLLYIIDCRFPYEFEGGHIKSAVNVNTTDELEKLLLQPAITDRRVLLIFHCEFSCERGPRMARHLRNQDRAANASHYPAVFYPEVYVMQGGYSGFFKENKTYCWPEAYVEMQDEKHSKEFEEHMRTFGREFSRSASKGFLGTESKKLNNGGGSAPSSSPLKTKVEVTTTANASTSSSATHSGNVANPGKASDSTNGTNSTSSGSSANTRTTSGTSNTLSASTTLSATSAASTTVGTTAKYGADVSTKAPNTKAFANVLTSVKAAALSGSAPTPLSLPSVSRRSILGVPSNKLLTLHRPSTRPRAKTVLSEHILKNSNNTSDARISTSGDSTVSTTTITTATAANTKTHGNSNPNSSTLPNPFFSGFRQTKPVFRGVSP
ncbi:cell division cycle- protein [Mortierella sp. AD010]|nr:cell division cycle- protein [Mortierella sp. AD010]